MPWCSAHRAAQEAAESGDRKDRTRAGGKEHPWRVPRPALQIGGLRAKKENPQSPQHSAPGSPRQAMKK